MKKTARVKRFRKELLGQDELMIFCMSTVDKARNAGFPDLALTTDRLEAATLNFKKLIHPIEDMGLTAQLAALDKERDKYVSAIYHGIAFGRCYFDPAVVRAANKLRMVVRDESYRHLQRTAYQGATNKIEHLLKEFNTNCADAVATLNLEPLLQKLQETNTRFRDTYIQRNIQYASLPDSKQIRQARTELEYSFDYFRNQLNSLAFFNGETIETHAHLQTAQNDNPATTPSAPATTYTELIMQLNTSIDKSVVAAKHRLTLYRKAKAKKQAETKDEA